MDIFSCFRGTPQDQVEKLLNGLVDRDSSNYTKSDLKTFNKAVKIFKDAKDNQGWDNKLKNDLFNASRTAVLCTYELEDKHLKQLLNNNSSLQDSRFTYSHILHECKKIIKAAEIEKSLNKEQVSQASIEKLEKVKELLEKIEEATKPQDTWGGILWKIRSAAYNIFNKCSSSHTIAQELVEKVTELVSGVKASSQNPQSNMVLDRQKDSLQGLNAFNSYQVSKSMFDSMVDKCKQENIFLDRKCILSVVIAANKCLNENDKVNKLNEIKQVLLDFKYTQEEWGNILIEANQIGDISSGVRPQNKKKQEIKNQITFNLGRITLEQERAEFFCKIREKGIRVDAQSSEGVNQAENPTQVNLKVSDEEIVGAIIDLMDGFNRNLGKNLLLDSFFRVVASDGNLGFKDKKKRLEGMLTSRFNSLKGLNRPPMSEKDYVQVSLNRIFLDCGDFTSALGCVLDIDDQLKVQPQVDNNVCWKLNLLVNGLVNSGVNTVNNVKKFLGIMNSLKFSNSDQKNEYLSVVIKALLEKNQEIQGAVEDLLESWRETINNKDSARECSPDDYQFVCLLSLLMAEHYTKVDNDFSDNRNAYVGWIKWALEKMPNDDEKVKLIKRVLNSKSLTLTQKEEIRNLLPQERP